MELIDYSDYYFRTKLKEALPPQRSGKFVQIRENPVAEFIVLSPSGFSTYHADIVRHFCSQTGIMGIYNNEHKHFDISDPKWRVIGGGKWSIDEGLKTLRLYGYSQAYGSFNPLGLTEGLSKINSLSGYEISTGS
ncbi:hypothetical protein [Candidatus Magnetominusculus xianensis]|uniref:Janus/Ocnus family protein n=1 Tax=Candidatus Magnetominusculus xianensis TaxID=1748249 RepID=A0ABR5SN26_9BACT|nr:hypothetical protein [Candidatus Magnetominusculus xianensis]KWT94348.1 Janus/Ocnus family protein [Candidatus Magnetominusculus xianensis]MBF0404002.1 hypothetical protein [Nitrospirota bacterium]